MNSKVCVEFKVKTNTKNGEVVCITGGAPELGSWKHHGVVPLSLHRKLPDGSEVWTKSINVSWRDELEYRFLKAHILEPQHEGDTSDIMVTSWESAVKPRIMHFRAPAENSEEELTTYGTYDGRSNVDQGWLTGQAEVRLRLHSNPITMWKSRYQQQIYRIKCTAVDLKHNDDEENSDEEMPMGSDEDESNHDLLTLGGAHSVYVSVSREGVMLPHDQPQCGTVYLENDYMVFRVETFDLESLGYQFDLYVSHPNSRDTDIPKHVGTAYILPVNLNETTGIKNVPISGLKHKPIGQLRVDYLIIRSMPGDVSDMSVTYARHWAPNKPIDVGHRGLGSTYDNNQCIPTSGSPRRYEVVKENTIASLSEAGGHGAHYVEFDVHLSRDGVPVIYHDFVVTLSLKQKNQRETEKFKIPLHDLTVDQLRMLKIYHGENDASHDIPDASNDADEDIDERPFPTLKECFERIDQKIGFNVEIKYCMPLRKGGLEMDVKHYRERNNYIDVILSEVLLHSGHRPIVFSCFDPDVCTMIRLKQNKYPVLQLCNNPRPQWPDYRDTRTWNINEAIAHCVTEGLLGINPNTQDLLDKPELVQIAKDHGLVVFCWGDETNSKETIAKMKQLGVDGVIYDKIHELKGGLSEESMFTMDNEEQERALLSDVGMMPPTNGGSLLLQKAKPPHSNGANGANGINNGSNTGFSGLIPSANNMEEAIY